MVPLKYYIDMINDMARKKRNILCSFSVVKGLIVHEFVEPVKINRHRSF